MAPAALKDEGLGAETGRLAAGSADSLDVTSRTANRPFLLTWSAAKAANRRQSTLFAIANRPFLLTQSTLSPIDPFAHLERCKRVALHCARRVLG